MESFALSMKDLAVKEITALEERHSLLERELAVVSGDLKVARGVLRLLDPTSVPTKAKAPKKTSGASVSDARLKQMVSWLETVSPEDDLSITSAAEVLGWSSVQASTGLKMLRDRGVVRVAAKSPQGRITYRRMP